MNDTTTAEGEGENTTAPGHNLPPIAELGDKMQKEAKLFQAGLKRGEKHKHEIMACAFTLRGYCEDPNLGLLVSGMLGKAGIKTTAKTKPFTALLKFAFQEVDYEAEKSRVSRWGKALEFAWCYEPRPTAEAVSVWIANHGGDKGCAKGLKAPPKPTTAPPPSILLVNCGIPAGLFPAGKTEIKGKLRDKSGTLEFVPSEPLPAVASESVSGETTGAVSQEAGTAP